ncbi:MAG TPA: single-stranded DNA-binding protein, partial [Ruminococcaceae bacterium]|nr:single-stranded DNA-binding protein [Oscillospiraceae bacterium]
MKEAIGTGPTVEEAKEAACKKLGVESYEAEFEILEMPTRKTFGLFGGSPARVRVYIEDDPAEAAAKYLKNVLSRMGVSGADVSVRKEEGGALLTLSGSDIGFVIGHRGETLDALQYLAGLVANHKGGPYYRVALDIGHYREKRRRTLESLGRKMAEKSLRTGRNVSLEPMNPYERRIIHTSVQTVAGAKSWSEGEDLRRHVVIGPVAGERRRPSRAGNRYPS